MEPNLVLTGPCGKWRSDLICRKRWLSPTLLLLERRPREANEAVSARCAGCLMSGRWGRGAGLDTGLPPIHCVSWQRFVGAMVIPRAVADVNTAI